MASIYIIIPVVSQGFFLMTGSTGNFFILFTHFADWMDIGKSSPVDLIICCIVINNIFLQGSIAFNQICTLLFLDFYLQVWVVNSLVVIMTSLSFSSLWCSTCLCYYYFVKIINLSQTWFYKMKSKLPIMVPWLLLFSCAISWAAGLTAYWELYTGSPLLADNATMNVSYVQLDYNSKCGCIFQIFMFLACIPFTIIFITSVALVISLCKHMLKMKNNEGSRNSKVSSHLKATRTVIALFIVYLIFYGLLNVIFSVRNGGDGVFLCCVVLAAAFPTGNAIILISGNRKLIEKFKKLLGLNQTSLNVEETVTTY